LLFHNKYSNLKKAYEIFAIIQECKVLKERLVNAISQV
jgi:hypothetical protein